MNEDERDVRQMLGQMKERHRSQMPYVSGLQSSTDGSSASCPVCTYLYGVRSTYS